MSRWITAYICDIIDHLFLRMHGTTFVINLCVKNNKISSMYIQLMILFIIAFFRSWSKFFLILISQSIHENRRCTHTILKGIRIWTIIILLYYLIKTQKYIHHYCSRYRSVLYFVTTAFHQIYLDVVFAKKKVIIFTVCCPRKLVG